MKFEPIPPLIAFCFLSFMGFISYRYLSYQNIVPQGILDQYYLFMAVFTIPFLIWMGFGHTDKEMEVIQAKAEQEKRENDMIKTKYDLMPDLKYGSES